MRIDSEQLPQHLKRGLQPLYLIFGDELLLAIEAADRIRAAAAASGHDERKVFVAESGFNWSDLLASSGNLSLFSSKRVLDLRIPSGKPGKDGSEALVALAGALPEDTITLVSLPGLDRQAQASRWFEALERRGVAVHAAPVGRERLPKWIANRLALQGQKASDETLAFIADRVEGNLMAAHQEVLKLALLFPQGELPANEVRNAVLDVARFDVFELGPALLRGERAHFVRVLDGLRGEGEPLPLVLWAIAEQARAIACVHDLTAHGTPMAQALRDAKVWGPRQQAMPKALARLDRHAAISALSRAAQVDRIIKGLREGDAWDALLALGLSLMPAR